MMQRWNFHLAKKKMLNIELVIWHTSYCCDKVSHQVSRMALLSMVF